MDVLLLAQIDNLLLREARVVLDLVDGRADSCLGEELLKVRLAVLEQLSATIYPCDTTSRKESHVANANRLGLATSDKSLHLLPVIGMIPVADDIACAICKGWELLVISCAEPLAFRTSSRRAARSLPSGLARTGQC